MGVFQTIQMKIEKCSVDFFAFGKSAKFSRYVSYLPDNRAIAINAFSLSWSNEMNYIFHPFSLLGTILQRLWEDKAEAVLIAPIFYPTHNSLMGLTGFRTQVAAVRIHS